MLIENRLRQLLSIWHLIVHVSWCEPEHAKLQSGDRKYGSTQLGALYIIKSKLFKWDILHIHDASDFQLIFQFPLVAKVFFE